MSGTDPIRDWAQRRRTAQTREIENAMTGSAEAEQTPPAVESLTAGSQPSDHKPPTLDDRFREWARESSYGRAPEYPPAA